MDQIFTLDRDDFRTTLDIVCSHLTSIDDLFSLESVSLLSSSVVRAHHYAGEVTLSWPADKDLTSPPLRGPVITRLRITLEESSESLRRALCWMLITIQSQATHLKQLTLHIRCRSSYLPDKDVVLTENQLVGRMVVFKRLHSDVSVYKSHTGCNIKIGKYMFLSYNVMCARKKDI